MTTKQIRTIRAHMDAAATACATADSLCAGSGAWTSRDVEALRRAAKSLEAAGCYLRRALPVSA